MSQIVRRATATPYSASISTPVLYVADASHVARRRAINVGGGTRENSQPGPSRDPRDEGRGRRPEVEGLRADPRAELVPTPAIPRGERARPPRLRCRGRGRREGDRAACGHGGEAGTPDGGPEEIHRRVREGPGRRVDRAVQGPEVGTWLARHPP